MSAFSFSHSATFTITHAKYLASKIVADLNVCNRLHGRPTVSQVESYSEELIELLRYGYLSRYEFGFKRDAKRVLSWSDKKPGTVPLAMVRRNARLVSVAGGRFDPEIERFERFCHVVEAPFAPLSTSSTGGGAALTSG